MKQMNYFQILRNNKFQYKKIQKTQKQIISMGNCCPQQEIQNNDVIQKKNKKKKMISNNISIEQIRQIRIQNFEKEINQNTESQQNNFQRKDVIQTNLSIENSALLDSQSNFFKNDEINAVQIQSDFKDISQSNEIVIQDLQFEIKNEPNQIQYEEKQSLEREQDNLYDIEIYEKIKFLLQPCIFFSNMVIYNQILFQKQKQAKINTFYFNQNYLIIIPNQIKKVSMQLNTSQQKVIKYYRYFQLTQIYSKLFYQFIILFKYFKLIDIYFQFYLFINLIEISYLISKRYHSKITKYQRIQAQIIKI
ncbi:transmembrane protein, putative (macronuclear) [Tetrahymena thermophila SB210]|uniref:Transmembrane protein, putative n=1 Tax=Tetrahymena thermophila (strain SB210) TaxID=312017 RepID=W7XE71_TETTS|nr:transmembrane protein, putative [Tetrahymena thermophila SB210]EWS71164.1 transmembrane protein, putative [Tetrahymena thermophila SB210]|eukprot:XP_012656305.1 transmembrane protein, putative [Tetrahymena thermophila SB210]